MLKLFHDSFPTATAARTKARLLDVPLQVSSGAMFMKICLFSSTVVTNEEPSRKRLVITANDLQMSIAVKHHDLRRLTHIAPQEKWMTMCDVSVTGFELGSKVSPVEVTECPQEPLATLREEKLLPAALG